jgi:hypothetical protein
MRMTRLRASSTLGVMYENDDFGKDLVKGLKDGLGDKAASMILKEVSYEVTDPTIDSQITTLAGWGADIFFDASLPKFAAQAIRKMYDINWKPLHVLDNGSASVSVVLKPAGLEKSVGIISAHARARRTVIMGKPSPTFPSLILRWGRCDDHCQGTPMGENHLESRGIRTHPALEGGVSL